MDTDLIASILQNMADKITENLPAILTILLIILLGWGVSRIAAGLVKRLINRTGLNQVFKRSSIAKELDKLQPDRSLADYASRIIFWLLWLYIIFSALTTSGLNLKVTPFENVLNFLPNLFVAFLILVGGVLLAQVIGRWVQVGTAAAGVEFHDALGKGTRLLINVIVFITAIEELGIDLTPLTNALTNIITITAAGLALAFGLGAGDTVSNILAGYYAREHFELGDQIQLDEDIGTLEAIGTVNAEISMPDGKIVLPNKDLTGTNIKVRSKG